MDARITWSGDDECYTLKLIERDFGQDAIEVGSFTLENCDFQDGEKEPVDITQLNMAYCAPQS